MENSFALSQKVKEISGRKCRFMPAITTFSFKKDVKIDIDNKFYNFLFVGRLEKVKGVDVLLNAVKKLSEKKLLFNLNILGGGTLVDDLMNQCKLLNIEKYVKFIGWANEEVVSSYMKKSNCWVWGSGERCFVRN